jgi:hypothetical protein
MSHCRIIAGWTDIVRGHFEGTGLPISKFVEVTDSLTDVFIQSKHKILCISLHAAAYV